MPRIAQRTALLLLLLLGVLLGGTGVSARGKEGVADGPDSGGTVNKDVEEQAGDGEDGTPSNVCAAFEEAHVVLAKLHPGYYDHLTAKAELPTGFHNPLSWQQEGTVASALAVARRVVTALNPLNAVTKVTSSSKRRSRRATTKQTRDGLQRAIELLQEAQDAGCHDAMALRADVRIFSPHGLGQNLTEAFELYKQFLQHSSDPHAQFMVGFFYATGLGGAPRDQARATLYYTFSALQGYKPAQMAMGHRFWSGIGVKQDCQAALDYYERAAKTTYERFQKGPPGGETLPLNPWRLSDRFGGVYGPQASWAFTGVNANREAVIAQKQASLGESPHEKLDYLEFKSSRGHQSAAIQLGWYNYLGSTYPSMGWGYSIGEEIAEIPQNLGEAKAQFLSIARQVWPSEFDRNGKAIPAQGDETKKIWGRAAAELIGRMTLRGEGFKQDYRKARLWLERAAPRGGSSDGLGIIYRDGLGVKPDRKEALSYFKHAADHDFPESEVNLGKMLLEDNEIEKAAKYFESAIRHGARFEPFYHLGRLHADQARADAGIRSGSCGVAVGYYKLVSETGSWDENYLSEANRAWLRGEHDNALVGWWIAAEMGYETGQNNVAFVLDHGSHYFDNYPIPRDTSLAQWTRSAAQGNADAMIVVGDRYYGGVEPNETDFTRALAYYQTAADKHSAMAYWNVGWMYENGLGVPRDWHLAKRNYDHALDVSPHAYVPWLLSMGRLYVRSWINELRTGGAEPGLHLDEEEGREIDHPTVFEGLKRLFVGPADMEVDAGEQYEDHSGAGWEGAGGGGDDGGAVDDDDDGEETYYINDVDDLLESLVVLGLVLAISGLFWLRGRWAAEAMRQAQAAAIAR